MAFLYFFVDFSGKLFWTAFSRSTPVKGNVLWVALSIAFFCFIAPVRDHALARNFINKIWTFCVLYTGLLCQGRRRSRRRTPETGVYFTHPPRRNPIARVLVPGSGVPKQKKRTSKAPEHLTQHRAAARGSAPPHDDPSPTGQRAPRHGAGIRPPGGRHVSSGHIRARLAPVLYRSTSSFVVLVSGQPVVVHALLFSTVFGLWN